MKSFWRGLADQGLGLFLSFIGAILLLLGLVVDISYAILGMVLVLVGVGMYQAGKYSRRQRNPSDQQGFKDQAAADTDAAPPRPGCIYCGGPLDSARVFCTKCGRSNV